MIVVKGKANGEPVTILESTLMPGGASYHFVRFEDGFHARIAANEVEIISYERKLPYGYEARKVQNLQ